DAAILGHVSSPRFTRYAIGITSASIISSSCLSTKYIGFTGLSSKHSSTTCSSPAIEAIVDSTFASNAASNFPLNFTWDRTRLITSSTGGNLPAIASAVNPCKVADRSSLLIRTGTSDPAQKALFHVPRGTLVSRCVRNLSGSALDTRMTALQSVAVTTKPASLSIATWTPSRAKRPSLGSLSATRTSFATRAGRTCLGGPTRAFGLAFGFLVFFFSATMSVPLFPLFPRLLRPARQRLTLPRDPLRLGQQ